VTVRSQPRSLAEPGVIRLGTLGYRDAFDVEQTSSNSWWVYGLAHGEANKPGWIEASFLCPPAS
jgi:hypothetical protein